ncbi:MAG: hypothetical protein FWE53_03675 [Firmicutes bacterium]|nr:hypothetical protein [Bacillota bacterium]
MYTFEERKEYYQTLYGIELTTYYSNAGEIYFAGFNPKGEGAFAICNINSGNIEEAMIVFNFKRLKDGYNERALKGGAQIYRLKAMPDTRSVEVRDPELKQILSNSLSDTLMLKNKTLARTSPNLGKATELCANYKKKDGKATFFEFEFKGFYGLSFLTDNENEFGLYKMFRTYTETLAQRSKKTPEFTRQNPAPAKA